MARDADTLRQLITNLQQLRTQLAGQILRAKRLRHTYLRDAQRLIDRVTQSPWQPDAPSLAASGAHKRR